MICVVDASVAVKWFANADWALREGHIWNEVNDSDSSGTSGQVFKASAADAANPL